MRNRCMLQQGWTLQTSRKPVTKTCVLYGSIHMKYLQRKKVDKWLCGANGEGWEAGGMTVKRNEASLWGDGNVRDVWDTKQQQQQQH